MIICSVNKDWDEFNPSPFSNKYFSAPELYSMLLSTCFSPELYGQCSVRDDSMKGRITGAIKKVAVKFHLMPKTMKGKELLKRFFFGKLMPLPPEIKDGMAEYISPMPIAHDEPNLDYKVLFAVGRKVLQVADT